MMAALLHSFTKGELAKWAYGKISFLVEAGNFCFGAFTLQNTDLLGRKNARFGWPYKEIEREAVECFECLIEMPIL